MGGVPAMASGSGGCRVDDKSLSVDVGLVVGTEGISSLQRWELRVRAKGLRDTLREIKHDEVEIRESWLSDYGFNLRLDLKDAELLIETRRSKRFDDRRESFPITYRGFYLLVVGGDARSTLKGEAECWLGGDG
jgi:hypothetical protein